MKNSKRKLRRSRHKNKRRNRKPDNRRPIRHPIKTIRKTTHMSQDQAKQYYEQIEKSMKQGDYVDDRQLVKQSIQRASKKQLWTFGIVAFIVFAFILCSLFL